MYIYQENRKRLGSGCHGKQLFLVRSLFCCRCYKAISYVGPLIIVFWNSRFVEISNLTHSHLKEFCSRQHYFNFAKDTIFWYKSKWYFQVKLKTLWGKGEIAPKGAISPFAMMFSTLSVNIILICTRKLCFLQNWKNVVCCKILSGGNGLTLYLLWLRQ